MSFQVPKEFVEPKETMRKMVSFWARPTVITRLDTICDVSHVDRSEVLRLLVNLFLNDNDFQERVLRGLNNG